MSNNKNIYPMPFCRVEVALLSLVHGRLCVTLIKRQEPPFAELWALPGGVLRVALDQNLNAAAERIAGERLGTAPPNVQQLYAVGAKGRDPRGAEEWGLSVVFYSLVPEGSFTPTAGKRVSDLSWVPVHDQLPPMAFDHKDLVAAAVRAAQSDIANLDFPAGFLPERFTLPELQTLSEQVLGKQIDKSSFRRKLRERNLVEQINGEKTQGGAHRPAGIYKLKQREKLNGQTSF